MRSLACLLLISSVWAQTIAFTHANVIDGTGAPVKKDQTVIIRWGKIAQIGGALKIPPGAQTVDTTGKYMIPGLWDMHTHVAGITADPKWGKSLLPQYLAAGITSIRDMAGDIDALKSWQSQQAAGELAGPRMFVCGPFIDGSTQGFGFATDVRAATTPEEGRALVRELKAKGVDFIKVGSQLSRATFMAIADEAKKLKVPFVGHVPDAVTPSEAARAGMKSQEHLFGIALETSSKGDELRQQLVDARAKQDTPAVVRLVAESQQTTDDAKARALFAEFKKNGTWIVPTLAWTQITSTLSERTDDPGLKPLPADLQKQWAPGQKVMSDGAQKYYARKYESDAKLVGMMNTAGVQILAGSDSLDPYVFPGSSLHRELELLVKAGLTPMQALQAATIQPSRFFGIQMGLGTIERGKNADLVLLDANPLEDIRNTRKVFAVMWAGRYYPKAQLEAMVETAVAAAK